MQGTFCLLRDIGIDLIECAKGAIRDDNEEHFVICLRHHLEMERIIHGKPFGSTFCMKELLKHICIHRATNCANALLQGDADIFVDDNIVNLPLEEGGLPPLHLAAQNLSFGVTKAFLMSGADPNLCCHSHGDDVDDCAKLPLSLAIEALSCNRCVAQWSVDKSVPKLIYIFCLKELKEPLNTIKILASRTQHLEKLSLQYAQKGDVVKLTALLLVAWNKLVTPYVELQQGAVECCPIAQCILNELQQGTTSQCNSNLVKHKSAWNMLKLLESNYHQIDMYRFLESAIYDDDGCRIPEVENHEVPYNVASRLEVGGPEDVCCDDIECLMPKLKPKEKAWLDRALQTHSGQTGVHSLASKKGFAATRLLKSHPNSTNGLQGQRSLSTKVEKPSFRSFLPTAKTCARLISIAKRRFK